MSRLDYQWLANFGFAAVVAVYFMFRMEVALRNLTRAINEMAVLIARFTNQDYDTVRELIANGR